MYVTSVKEKHVVSLTGNRKYFCVFFLKFLIVWGEASNTKSKKELFAVFKLYSVHL